MAQRYTSKRRKELSNILITDGSIKISDMAKKFGVSRETIRKDLLFLESEGIGIKGRGGAMFVPTLEEQPLTSRSTENIEEKQRIAQAALKLLPQEGTIILDSGSTTFSFAAELKTMNGLKIITNSATIPPYLAESNNTVFSLGGEIRNTSKAYIGIWTLNALQTVHCDVAFLAADGVSENGPCTSVYAESEVKKAMISSANIKVLLIDSSKFQRNSLVQFCDWKQIDYIITDSRVTKEDLSVLPAELKVIIV